MMMRVWSGRGLAASRVLSGVGLVIGLSMGAQGSALATSSTIGYSLANVGPYGGEPSITSDRLGRLYDTTPTGGTITYTSTTSGRSWSQVTTADPSSGDDCIDTDQSTAVYLCNLAGSQGSRPSRPTSGSPSITERAGPMERAPSPNAGPAAPPSASTAIGSMPRFPPEVRRITRRSCSCTTTSTDPARSG